MKNGIGLKVEGPGTNGVLFQELFFFFYFLACSLRVFEKYIGAHRRVQSMVEE